MFEGSNEILQNLKKSSEEKIIVNSGEFVKEAKKFKFKLYFI